MIYDYHFQTVTHIEWEQQLLDDSAMPCYRPVWTDGYIIIIIIQSLDIYNSDHLPGNIKNFQRWYKSLTNTIQKIAQIL